MRGRRPRARPVPVLGGQKGRGGAQGAERARRPSWDGVTRKGFEAA